MLELGITEEVRKTAPAVVETITVNEEKELQLRLPEYWQQIYSVQTNAVDNCTIINLHEKYNFDRRQAGLLASIDVYDRAYYEQNIMQLSPEVYGQIIGANSIILGTDDVYVYLMWAPTDVQFDYEDELATALYQAGWQAKDKIMADFFGNQRNYCQRRSANFELEIQNTRSLHFAVTSCFVSEFLYVKTEQHNVAVLYHIVFAFYSY